MLVTYEKFIKKDGKTYGPYIYKSVRKNGEIITEYVGKGKNFGVREEVDAKKGFSISKNFIFISGAILVVALLLFLAFNYNFEKGSRDVTGRLILEPSPVYGMNETILGDVKIKLKHGEFLPINTSLKLKLNDQEKESFFLNSVQTSNGEYYAENSYLSGNGEGFGYLGEKRIYPDVNFKILIYRSVDENAEIEEPVSQNVNETPLDIQIPIVEEIPVENEIPVEVETPVENEVPETLSEVLPEEETAETGVVEIIETSSNEESSSEPTGVSLVTSNAVLDSYEIEGVIIAGESFVYQLNDGESAELVSGSVVSEDFQISDDLIKVSLNGSKAVVSSSYYKSEEGFGQDYLTNDIEIVKVDLEDFGIRAEQGFLQVYIVSDGVQLASSSELISIEGQQEEIENISFGFLKEIPDIDLSKDSFYMLNLSEYLEYSGASPLTSMIVPENISFEIQGQMVKIVPDLGFEGTRSTKMTLSSGKELKESNLFNIIVSDQNISIDTEKVEARLGRPVRWKKTVSVQDSGSFVVEVPYEAEKIVVSKVDPYETKAEANFEETNSVTGGVVMEINLETDEDAWIVGVFKKIWDALTGMVVLGEIEFVASETKNILIDDNATEYEIEYETPAPYAIENGLRRGDKEVTISSEIPYVNIGAYTFIEETSRGNIKVIGAGESEFVDNNGDGLVDEVDWVSDSGDSVIIQVNREEDKAISRESNSNTYLAGDNNFVSHIYSRKINVEDNGHFVPITDVLDVFVDYENNIHVSYSDSEVLLKPYYYSGSDKIYLSNSSIDSFSHTHLYNRQGFYKYALGIFNFDALETTKIGFEAVGEGIFVGNKLLVGEIEVDFSDLDKDYSLESFSDSIEVSGSFSDDVYLDPSISLTVEDTAEDGYVVPGIPYTRNTTSEIFNLNGGHSYIQFNTSFINESALIVSIYLNYSLPLGYAGSPIRHTEIERKISEQSDEDLYSDIENGSIYNLFSILSCNGGWCNVDLSGGGNDLQSQLASDWFAVGLYSGASQDIETSDSSNPPVLTVTWGEIGVLQCGELNRSNFVYSLSNDMYYDGGPNSVCFNITADNITLNGNGYHAGVVSNAGNERLIYAENINNLSIINMEVGSSTIGYVFAELVNITTAWIFNNSYSHVGGNSTDLRDCQNVHFVNNTAVSYHLSSNSALLRLYAENRDVKNNLIDGNNFSDYGGYLNGNGSGITLSSSDLTNFSILSNNITRNYMRRVETYGLIPNISSFKLIGSSGSGWIGNVSGNYIYNNYIEGLSHPDQVIISGRVFKNYWNISKIAGVNILGGNYLGGNYWSYYLRNSCGDNDNDGLCESSFVLDENNTDYLPLFISDITDCGVLASSNVNYRLTQDIFYLYSPSVCFNLTGSNVTFDGQGYDVFLLESRPEYAGNVSVISVSGDNVILKNHNIGGGVLNVNHVYGLSANDVVNLTVVNSTLIGRFSDILSFSGLTDSKFSNNHFQSHNETTGRIMSLSSSSDNESSFNLFENNYMSAGDGIRMSAGTNSVYNNTFRNNTIRAVGSSAENQLLHDVYFSAPGAGNISSNIFYNNLFYEYYSTQPAWIPRHVNISGRVFKNYWNTTATFGTNIVGGAYIAGNYWNYYSDNCGDNNSDGICNDYRILDENNTDYGMLFKFVPAVVYYGAKQCTQECFVGMKRCSANSVDICGNYDEDPCYEWGNLSLCDEDLVCRNGVCAENVSSVESCSENWQCNWSSCDSLGLSYASECMDLNDCGTNLRLPSSKRCEVGYGGCSPIWNCIDWGNCDVGYSVGDVFDFEGLKGRQERRCYDLNSCFPDVVETQECSANATVSLNTVSCCYGEQYVEVYDQNSGGFISRIRELEIDGDQKLNLIFSISNFSGYCAYCSDGVMNFDEEGVDCGGNCSSCYELSYVQDISAPIISQILWVVALILTLVLVGYLHIGRNKK